jgi:hypothetical protein
MSRLCVHTITTKPLSLEQCLTEYPKRGVGGITAATTQAELDAAIALPPA